MQTLGPTVLVPRPHQLALTPSRCRGQTISVSRPLKYAHRHAELACCPPPDAKPAVGRLFRFVRLPVEDEWNYLPRALQQPNRCWKGEDECCSALALSCFRTHGAARKLWKGIAKRHKNIRSDLGSVIAFVDLCGDDGLVLPTAPHTDLHEFDGASLKGRYHQVEEL